MKAIVVGAGVGGLCTAVALRKAGIGVMILEHSDEIGEIGAGLSLWPNALRALRELGLYETVMAVSNPLRPASELRTARGEILSSVPAERMDERFGEPAAAVHRADLQKVLLRAAEDSGVEIRIGASLVGFEQDETGIVARFQTGGGVETAQGDLLIGADGIRSTVREAVLGDGEPRYAGYVAWRGVAYFEIDGSGAHHGPPDPVGSDGGLEAWGVGQRFGLAKIGRPGAYWWYATKNAPEGEAEHETEDGVGHEIEYRNGNPARLERRKAEVLSLFGGWAAPVPEIIRATAAAGIHRDRVYDRDPAQSWGVGGVTLLGDAAHPMTPDLGQGACQAIEDAVVLGRNLQAGDGVEAALRQYENERRRRTAKVVLASRRLGRTGQLGNTLACRARDGLLRKIPSRYRELAELRQLEGVIGRSDVASG